jgi:hypothetical protein
LSGDSVPMTTLPVGLVRVSVSMVPSATVTLAGMAGLTSTAPGSGAMVTLAGRLGAA